MTEPILISNLHKTYVRRPWLGNQTQKTVLNGIDLTLRSGIVLGLVGESGCGKSTLCKILLGIEPVTSGKVEILGQNVNTLSAREWRELRRHIQVIFQDPYASLDPRLTVRQLVSEPLDVYGLYKGKKEREDYLRELLLAVQLDPDFLDRYPHEFSGGQRQRIAIARALALNPQILIADEPTTALDVTIQAQILKLIKDLQRQNGMSVIFITHNLAVAAQVADEVLVLYAGQCMEQSPAAALFKTPLHPYTQALFSAIPIPDPDVKINRIVLEGSIPSPANPPSGCKFHTRCAKCMEICKTVVPEYREVEPNHFCACHLYDAANEG